MNIFIASIENKIARLTPNESHHCAKVLRMKASEQIHIIDGKGNFYTGILTVVSDKKCEAEVVSGPNPQAKRNYYLHLAIAPTKQIDRIEWMIEKAVEIGVDEISFVQCKNSERTTIKIERINKIIESAVKQSLQAFMPKINELIMLKEFLSKNKADQKLIAHCNDSEKKDLRSFEFKNRSTLVLIGPEGDFTKEEIAMASEQKFIAISLGDTRLRSETAGLYVCQAISILT